MSDPPDAPTDDATDDARGDAWPAEVGRKLLAYRMASGNDDVADAIHGILNHLYADQDPTAEDIQAARTALDELRHDIEEFAAPVAGVDPWDDGINQLAPNWAERSWSDREAATDGGRERDR